MQTTEIRELTPELCVRIAMDNGNMTIKAVKECLLQGNVIDTGLQYFQMFDARERWNRFLTRS